MPALFDVGKGSWKGHLPRPARKSAFNKFHGLEIWSGIDGLEGARGVNTETEAAVVVRLAHQRDR